MGKNLRVSADGLYLIKKYEGLHKINPKTGMVEAYLDPVKIPTIGYGHIKGVKLGMAISDGEAEILLHQDVKEAEGFIKSLVKVDIIQQEFDALISFVFNVGAGNFKNSSVLKYLNMNKRETAAQCLLAWDKAKVDGKLTTLPGLSRRRMAEMNLFLYGPSTLYTAQGKEEWTISLLYLESAHALITTSKRAA